MSEETQSFKLVVNRPLSRTFRAAAGFLFLMSAPVIYFDVLDIILGNTDFSTVGKICLSLSLAHVYGTVLFTGFAPSYLVNLGEAEEQRKHV